MKKKSTVKKIARDLGLDDFDATFIAMKAQLYKKAAEAIDQSDYSHEKIAKMVGTSRTRITRIANMGESSVSIEMLSRIIYTLEEKMPIQIAV